METKRDKVYRVLVASEGLPLAIGEIAERTGLVNQQVSQAMYGLVNDDLGIERASLGMYVYKSLAPEDNRDEVVDIFERVGWLDTEPPTPILRANDGSHWKAVPL